MTIEAIKQSLQSGEMVPFLGLGIYAGYRYEEEGGNEIPSTNDALIIAMNSGRAMAPRYMIDYSRALMSLEQRKGRPHVDGMMNLLYSKPMQIPTILSKLLTFQPHYLIDTNYDPSIQKQMKDRDYNLIVGRSRISSDPSRYEIFRHEASSGEYHLVNAIDYQLPILFKPMGTTEPTPAFICSDADFVDWLTEAMGGFAMPQDLKEFRKEKKYLFLGLPFDRDTERMVANEMTLDLSGGVIVYEGEFGKKAQQFAEKHNLEQLVMSAEEFAQQL